MALDTYANLKTAILDWKARSDLSGSVADWITLAEAGLNRELNPVEVDQSLTGTSSSREIDTSSYSVVEPIALYIVDTDTSDERELVLKKDFARTNTNDEPSFWDFYQHATAPKIIFDCPLDAAYTFRFRYRQRFALSDSATTNWLLTNHPDIYLAASLVWGGGYTMDYENGAVFKAILDQGIPQVRNIIAQSRRGLLSVDPALIARPRPGSYQGVE